MPNSQVHRYPLRVHARPEVRVKRSTTDDDVRLLAAGIGLGEYRNTVRTGFGRRVLLFDNGLIERRSRSIRFSFDGLEPTAIDRLLEGLDMELQKPNRFPWVLR